MLNESLDDLLRSSTHRVCVKLNEKHWLSVYCRNDYIIAMIVIIIIMITLKIAIIIKVEVNSFLVGVKRKKGIFFLSCRKREYRRLDPAITSSNGSTAEGGT